MTEGGTPDVARTDAPLCLRHLPPPNGGGRREVKPYPRASGVEKEAILSPRASGGRCHVVTEGGTPDVPRTMPPSAFGISPR